MIIYENTNQGYVEEALSLAMAEYQKESASNDQLMTNDLCEGIRELLNALFQCRYGKVAMEDGKMIGYLAFWGPIEGFFGSAPGAFSPLGGSAFAGKDRAKTASLLFEHVSQEMVQDGVYCYGASRYAHDIEVGTSFVMNGFGIRCSDAILRLADRKRPQNQETDLTFQELSIEQRPMIRPLYDGLIRHLLAAPIFMTTPPEHAPRWFRRTDLRVFAAMNQEVPVGYLAICDDGENFLTEYPSIKNICGAYVAPEYRGGNTAVLLLESLCQAMEQEGYEYLGVDCETLNPTALRFWGKHFNNYTYSYVRRIDERIEAAYKS